MAIELKLDAEKRTDLGKGASRRLRRAKKIPAVLYGGNKDAVSLQIAEQQLMRMLDEEAFYTQVIKVNVEGKTEQAVLKALQRHPYKPLVQHVDLMRVDAKTRLTTLVPLRFINEEAVKKAGGVLVRGLNEITVESLPQDVPQYIEVDCSDLKPGSSLYLSQLKLPEGVTIPVLALGPEHDDAVVTVRAGRGAAEAAEEPTEEEGGEEEA